MALPPAIPLPTVRSPEYDAPPPVALGRAGLQGGQPFPVTRPASQIVNIPNEMPRASVMPEYDAPAPAARVR
jgi:hypothetical protein